MNDKSPPPSRLKAGERPLEGPASATGASGSLVNLLEFDHKVSELESKANLAKGKTKVELENKLHQIRASRATFAADYQALENQTGAAWDSAKEKLDQEWTELKALVDKAE